MSENPFADELREKLRVYLGHALVDEQDRRDAIQMAYSHSMGGSIGTRSSLEVQLVGYTIIDSFDRNSEYIDNLDIFEICVCLYTGTILQPAA